MNHSLTIAILAGLGGMFGWGIADFFAKKTVDRIESIKGLVWAHLFGTSLFLLIAVSDSIISKKLLSIPTQPNVWAGLAFFGWFQMIIYLLVYEGFKKGQLSILNPVFASFTGLVALISIIGFGERLTAPLALALSVIFIGILALNIDLDSLKKRKLNIVPGLKEVGIATIFAALWTILWDKFIGGQSALSYALFMYMFMSLSAFIMARFLRIKLSGIDRDLWKYLVLIGLGETVAYLAISWGYSATSLTSIVALISGAFSLPTLVLAFVFLKERITRVQLAAIILIITGIVIVSVTL